MDQWYTVNQFRNAYPVVNSDCTVNKICRKFESLEKKLKSHNGSRDMLLDYFPLCDIGIDQKVSFDIYELICNYYNQRRFITRSNNVDSISNNKIIAKETKERLDTLQNHIKEQIEKLCNDSGDEDKALSYLIDLLRRKKIKENFVWDIFEDDVLKRIPEKPYKLKWRNAKGC